MIRPAELAATWREQAARYEADGLTAPAVLLRRVAGKLDAAQRAAEGEELTLEAAARESGYSRDRLRHLLAEGAIPNVGRRGAPRVRRADLPQKGKRAGGFDPSAAARRVLRQDLP